jgi:predicted RNase H-like HicB family nuclease
VESKAIIEIVFTVEEDATGGFVATAAGASIHVQADTIEELREAARDAVHCHYAEADRPRLIRLHFVRDEIIDA